MYTHRYTQGTVIPQMNLCPFHATVWAWQVSFSMMLIELQQFYIICTMISVSKLSAFLLSHMFTSTSFQCATLSLTHPQTQTRRVRHTVPQNTTSTGQPQQLRENCDFVLCGLELSVTASVGGCLFSQCQQKRWGRSYIHMYWNTWTFSVSWLVSRFGLAVRR